MYPRFSTLLIYLTTGLSPFLGQAQAPKSIPAPPARKIIDKGSIDYLDFKALRFHLHNAVDHYGYVDGQVANLTQINQMLTDSVLRFKNQLQAQTAQLAQLRQSARQLENAQAAVRATRDSARRSMESLNFERQLLKDTRAVRVYKFPVNDVRKVFTDNLNRDNAGFMLNNASAGNTLIVSREFNQQAPAWWDIDREDDGRLDVTLRLVEHPYDNSRTVLYADTRLLKKDRTGNKPIQDQSDPEKLQLYRDRTIRLLEGFLRVTSEK